MAAEFKVLLCGTGDNAAWHLAESRRSGKARRAGARISHVFGRDQERVRRFAARQGLTPVFDAAECLRSGQVQGVDVCTSHDRHFPLAKLAVEAGLPTLVEKPLAAGLAQAEELVALAQARGVPLGILYHKRYAPQHRALRDFIAVGGFGQGPLEVEMSIHHAADARYFRWGESWKASVDQNGGGILMNQVVHYLDLLTWWLGEFSDVDAKLTLGQTAMEGESTADLRIGFVNGHRARFLATVAVRKSLPVHLAVHGRRGSLVLNGLEIVENSIGLEADDLFRIRPLADRLVGRIPYRFRRRLGLPLSRLDMESAGAGWEEFFARVARNRPVLTPAGEGLAALRLVERAYGGTPPRQAPPPGMIPPQWGRSALDYYQDLAGQEAGLDALLVNPLLDSPHNRRFAHIQTHRPRPPLELASLAAWLRQAGFQTRAVDAAGLGFDLDQTVFLIQAFAPRLLVLTSAQLDRWQNPMLDLAPLTELIKRVKAGGVSQVILLGPHGSAKPAWALHATGADYVVRAEPERTVTELVQVLTHGGSLEMVAGLAWLEEGLARESLPRSCDDDLDEYPSPAYGDLPLTRYEYTDERLPQPYCSMLSARGCPARCVFCLKAMMPGKWRAQSAERVAAEMELLNKTYGIKSVYFQDWEFLLDKERAVRLCDLLLAQGLRMNWGFSTRTIYLTDPDLVTRLAQAGCRVINVGYETGAQELLKAIKKGITPQATRQAIENCRRAGIELRLFGLVNLPGESLRTIWQSVRFLMKNKAEVVHPNLPIPYPTTRLWEMAGGNWDWDQVGPHQGRVKAKLPPWLALAVFKELNRHRRFGWAYWLRPRFWRYLRIQGFFRLGRWVPGL